MDQQFPTRRSLRARSGAQVDPTPTAAGWARPLPPEAVAPNPWTRRAGESPVRSEAASTAASALEARPTPATSVPSADPARLLVRPGEIESAALGGAADDVDSTIPGVPPAPVLTLPAVAVTGEPAASPNSSGSVAPAAPPAPAPVLAPAAPVASTIAAAGGGSAGGSDPDAGALSPGVMSGTAAAGSAASTSHDADAGEATAAAETGHDAEPAHAAVTDATAARVVGKLRAGRVRAGRVRAATSEAGVGRASRPERERAGGGPRPGDVLRRAAPLVGVVRDLLGFGSRGGRSRWMRATQVLVAAAAVVTLFVGVRTIFVPSPAGSVPYSARFPQALAVSTAERFAEAYYTWDESDTQAHAEALADVMVAGVPRQAGWDGSGRSEAGAAAALGFSIVDASHALVTVVVPVTEYTGSPGSWREGDTEQRALSVPLQVVGPRTWVSGLPAAVGLPSAPQGTPAAPLPQDRATTSATRPVVAAFFQALERSGAVLAGPRAERAPGLDGSLAFGQLRSWSVHRTDEATKTGTAVVQWETPGGASLEQQYRVVVTHDGDAWSVSAVTAAFGGGTP
jgi:hypothetical protein